MHEKRPHRPHPVRHHLIDRGHSMTWLADTTNTRYPAMRKYVNGELTVPSDVAERVAAAMGLPVHLLFRVEELRVEVGV